MLCVAAAKSQQVTYSGVSKKEIATNLSFEIIGKVGKNYLVLKNNSHENVIQVFDQNMQQLSYKPASFLPQGTTSKTLINYPDRVMIICEYSDGQKLYTEAITIDEYGAPTGSVVLDSVNSYNVIYSDNKKNILLYMFDMDTLGNTRINTRLYDGDLTTVEEYSSFVKLSPKMESYKNFLLANDGTFSFTVSNQRMQKNEKLHGLDIIVRKPKTSRYVRVPVSFGNYYCGPLHMSVDNVNNRFLMNGLFSSERAGFYQLGLFTAVMHGTNYQVSNRFLYFSKELLRSKDTTNPAVLSKDFKIQNIILKKDGSFIVVAEKSPKRKVYAAPQPRYTPDITDKLYDPFMQNWAARRLWYYPDRKTGFGMQDYYVRELFHDILFLDIGSDLKLKNSEVISKNQNGDFNFSSFGLMNRGQKIDLFYLDDLKKTQLVNSRSFTADGHMANNPTLRTYQKGHSFMPRHMKQVSATEALIPTIYKGRIAFARLTFE